MANFKSETTSVYRFHSAVTMEVSQNETFELHYNDKFFTLNFALTNFHNPSENLYSYILDGYDKEWSEPSTSTLARFNSIPAGTYTFKVKAAADKNDWNEKQLEVKIIVQQAFFKTWWAYAGIWLL